MAAVHYILTVCVMTGCDLQGWEEGMVGLKKAGRRLVVVPPDQAYGAKGVPNRVPANSTLIFDVELRRVTPTDTSLHSPLVLMFARITRVSSCVSACLCLMDRNAASGVFLPFFHFR